MLQLEEYCDVHKLHIWAITMGKVVLACHVRVAPDTDSCAVLRRDLRIVIRTWNPVRYCPGGNSNPDQVTEL